jgi:hypothetical protein
VIGLTLAPGECKISKDGAAYANSTNLPVEIAPSSGRYSLDLTASEMDAGVIAIMVENLAIDPLDLIVTTPNQPSGAVVADGLNSSFTFKTDRTEVGTDFWKDCVVAFASGALQGQVRRVVGYDGSTKFMSVLSPLSAAPAPGDRFLLLNV